MVGMRGQVEVVPLADLRQQEVRDEPVEVVAAEMGIAVGGAHFNHVVADVQNRPRQAGVAANIPQPAKYLTVYTLNTRDIAAALDSMRARYKPSGDAPKLSASYNYVFRAITPIVQAKSPANPFSAIASDSFGAMFEMLDVYAWQPTAK